MAFLVEMANSYVSGVATKNFDGDYHDNNNNHNSDNNNDNK